MAPFSLPQILLATARTAPPDTSALQPPPILPKQLDALPETIGEDDGAAVPIPIRRNHPGICLCSFPFQDRRESLQVTLSDPRSYFLHRRKHDDCENCQRREYSHQSHDHSHSHNYSPCRPGRVPSRSEGWCSETHAGRNLDVNGVQATTQTYHEQIEIHRRMLSVASPKR